jgi:hypothetical protein
MDRAAAADRGKMMSCANCQRSFQIEEFSADGGAYAGSIWDQPDTPSSPRAGTWPLWTVVLFAFVLPLVALVVAVPVVLPAFASLAILIQALSLAVLLVGLVYFVIALVRGRRRGG